MFPFIRAMLFSSVLDCIVKELIVNGRGEQYDLSWSNLFLRLVKPHPADQGGSHVLDTTEGYEYPIVPLLEFLEQSSTVVEPLNVRGEVGSVGQRSLSRRTLDRRALAKRTLSWNRGILRCGGRCLRLVAHS
jgi:hypothetical protein